MVAAAREGAPAGTVLDDRAGEIGHFFGSRERAIQMIDVSV